MDFTLSNFSNSGINKISILCEKGQHSVRSHVGNGSVWISNTKTGNFDIIFNESGIYHHKFNTDIANLIANKNSVNNFDCEIVVVAPAFFLANIDFRKIIELHKAENREITVVYSSRKDARKSFLNCDALKVNSKSKTIRSVSINLGEEKGADISLETYIFSLETFKRLVRDAHKVSALYHIRDMVNYYIREKLIKVHGYQFDGYVVPILSMNDYVNYSLKLLKYTERQKLFNDDWPIYTTTHNTPPSLYGKCANVVNSFVANGSIIKGTVINSVISRNVVVEEGAVVKNSILFTKTHVGEGVELEYVVADKNTNITQVKKIKGEKQDAVFIKQGTKI
jgi:glucose-1-phosphate adenylyltransferase